MALDTTVGGSSSDSYVTVAEADTYLDASYHDDSEWTALSTVEKEFRLKLGALLMNMLPWRGAKACRNQRLEFPRWWRWDDEYPVDEDEYLDYSDITSNAPTVPQEVKDAQCEITWQVIHNGVLTADVLAFPEREIKSFELGGSLGIEFFPGILNKHQFSKAKLASMDVVAVYLNKWIQQFSGGVA